MQKKIPPSILNELKYYVYLYAHPTTKEIFYVGKGKDNRVFAHLEDTGDNRKVQYIKELKQQGLSPHIEVLIHGLEDEKTALRVEASVIDLIGIEQLTNKQSGYKSATYGRMTIEQINAAYTKEAVLVEEAAVLIRINQAFRYTMSPVELYDYTRGQWRINTERAKAAQYAFAVYEGIIQEVYTILNWYEAGETLSTRLNDDPIVGRSEFVGNIAPPHIRDKYRYKSVAHYFKKGNANPIMYLNI